MHDFTTNTLIFGMLSEEARQQLRSSKEPILYFDTLCRQFVAWRNPDSFLESMVYRIDFSKPSIDWSAVSTEFNWLYRTPVGYCYLSQEKPQPRNHQWYSPGKIRLASIFSSLKPGTINWANSLVERPTDA